MQLKQILADSRGGSLTRVPKFRVSQVRKAGMELAIKFTEAETLPPIVEIEDVAKRLAHAANTGSLDQVSRKDWSKAGWCLWLNNHALATVPAFLDAYLERVYLANKRSQYKKLISAYIRGYHPERTNVEKVGAFLAQGVQKWDWVWADRQRDLLFFAAAGPGNVARACLTSNGPIEAFLGSVGLGNTGESGFVAESYRKSLVELEGLSDEQFDHRLERVLEWSADSDGFRYPDFVSALANALLLRWQSKNPTDVTQQTIEDFLLTHFKDPRIPLTPGSKWSHASVEAKSVILRWLVGTALEQFLQVVDKIAMQSQWRYRRAFWTAYYKAGFIDEAWVAFAWQGQVASKQSFGEMKGFASLDGSGISPDHAVLIMKIAGLTIADWSHNGKCHIWTESNNNAPKLYRGVYSRNTLVNSSSNQGIVHASAPYGTWQATVASYIAKHTNIRMDRQDYMPKGRS